MWGSCRPPPFFAIRSVLLLLLFLLDHEGKLLARAFSPISNVFYTNPSLSLQTTTPVYCSILRRGPPPHFASSEESGAANDGGEDISNRKEANEDRKISETKERTSVDDDNDDDVDPANDEDFKAWVSSRVKQWPLVPPPANNNNNNAAGGGAKAGQGAEQNQPVASSKEEVMYGKQDQAAAGTMDAIGGLLRSAKSVVEDESSFVRSPLSRILNIETLLQSTATTTSATTENEGANNTTVVTTALKELSDWEKWVGVWKQPGYVIGRSAEGLLKQATASIESVVTEASSAVKPETVEALIRFSSETLSQATTNVTGATAEVQPPPQIGGDDVSGLNVTDATDRVRETTAFASSLLATADGLFRKGYLSGDRIARNQKQESFLDNVPAVAGSRALFDAFETAVELNGYSPQMVKAAEMGALAGAIYEDTLPRTAALGQTIVARGVTEDVAWMVTDSVANRSSFYDDATQKGGTPVLVRTITIRGFDASDDTIDRELLLNRVCSAEPKPIQTGTGVRVHAGLFEIARAIFQDIQQYIEWTAPDHKIVLCGHSIGGALSQLLLLLIQTEYGADFARNKILKVYTFGSPPVAVKTGRKSSRKQECDVLEAFQLPTSMVHGFVQPWDPIVRLFSEIDALYPLVSDLGPDGNTPFADGPPRALRPITKSIFEAWDGWPRFRENFKGTGDQTFTSIGVQHILLSSPTRYLADVFVAVNIPVPPVETILRLSNKELYPALVSAFPLDVYEISLIPQAIRSFTHHFYPAYGFPLVDYVKELKRRSRGLPERPSEFAFSQEELGMLSTTVAANGATPPKPGSESTGGIDLGKAVGWLIRSETKP